jgi:tRNA dimethylallyltransferase
MENMKKKIVAIVGPTGSGKTSLSITLAKKYHGEIISADSRQIYRGMDIGTAKTIPDDKLRITNCELPITSFGIPHFCVDIKNPNEDYSVVNFKRDADSAITEIARKGKLPMLVGGTGLYVWAVLDNLDIPEIKADPKLRARIKEDVEEKGLASVFAELVKLDPEAAYVVDPKNPRRVVRALEVALITGKPFTAQRKKKDSPYDALKLGINPPPEILRERINLRIDIMMKDGLLDEVKRLVETYGEKCVAFDAIGYREIISYLHGGISLESAIELMKSNTWHYAKRQMTWFKRDKDIHWMTNEAEAEVLVKNFLKQ